MIGVPLSSEVAVGLTAINTNTVHVTKWYAKKLKIKPDQLLKLDTFLMASSLIFLTHTTITEAYFDRVNLLSTNKSFLLTSSPE